MRINPTVYQLSNRGWQHKQCSLIFKTRRGAWNHWNQDHASEELVFEPKRSSPTMRALEINPVTNRLVNARVLSDQLAPAVTVSTKKQLLCRLGLHSWASTHTGRRCVEVGCDATRPR